jgi:hypothetical protein
MAYTQNPTEASHGVKRISEKGQPIVTSSTSTVALSSYCVNCFALKEKQSDGEPVRAIHKREGITSTLANNSITNAGAYNQVNAQTFLGNNIAFSRGVYGYLYNYSTNNITNWITSVNSHVGGVYCNLIDSSNARRLAIITSGSVLSTCLEDGTSPDTTALGALGIANTKGLVYINGYLFAVNNIGNKIYNSTAGGVYTTWNSTDFLDAEQYADQIQFIDKHKNYLVAFGQASTEFFYDNAIEVGSPLARQESYSSRVGIVLPLNATVTYPCTSHIGDDIYFIGKSESDTRSLYRVRNFQVEEIKNQYIGGILNTPGNEYAGINTYVINNNPMIVIEFESSSISTRKTFVYYPAEDFWWKLESADFPSYHARLGTPVVPVNNVYGGNYLGFIDLQNAGGAGLVYANYPDTTHATSVNASWTTPVIDFDNNRYKHLARIDAIGDYGNNVLSMSIDLTPNYNSASFSSVGSSITPSSIGYGNNISWYNCGSPRRFILNFAMSGTNHAVHRGFDIEYNMGIA